MGKLTGTRETVYSRDPALDRRDPPALEAALEKVRETGKAQGLPLRDGMAPVVWHIRSLSEEAYTALARTSANELRRAAAEDRLQSAILARASYPECRDAFRRGVVKVEGALDANGDPLTIDDKSFEPTPAGPRLTQATLDAIFERFKAGLIIEIGQQVIEACEVPPL